MMSSKVLDSLNIILGNILYPGIVPPDTVSPDTLISDTVLSDTVVLATVCDKVCSNFAQFIEPFFAVGVENSSPFSD